MALVQHSVCHGFKQTFKTEPKLLLMTFELILYCWVVEVKQVQVLLIFRPDLLVIKLIG